MTFMARFTLLFAIKAQDFPYFPCQDRLICGLVSWWITYGFYSFVTSYPLIQEVAAMSCGETRCSSSKQSDCHSLRWQPWAYCPCIHLLNVKGSLPCRRIAAELFSPGPFFPLPKSLNGTVHDCIALTLTSLRSMCIILLLAIIFAFLSLSVMDEPRHFKCGASLCGRTFNTSGGLLCHHPTCIHYQQQSVAIWSKSQHKRCYDLSPDSWYLLVIFLSPHSYSFWYVFLWLGSLPDPIEFI